MLKNIQVELEFEEERLFYLHQVRELLALKQRHTEFAEQIDAIVENLVDYYKGCEKIRYNKKI